MARSPNWRRYLRQRIGGGTRVPIRGGKNKTGKKGRVGRRGQIPELGNSIGKSLPGSKFFQGRKVTGAERWVWTLDLAVQRVLYYWLVADITEDFVTNWTTAIMESEDCRDQLTYSCVAVRTGPVPVVVDNWARMSAWNTVFETGPGFWTGFTGGLSVPSGAVAYCTLEATVVGSDPYPNVGGQVRLDASSGVVPTQAETPWPVNSNDNPQEPTMACIIYGPASVFTEVFMHGFGINSYKDAKFTCNISPV